MNLNFLTNLGFSLEKNEPADVPEQDHEPEQEPAPESGLSPSMKELVEQMTAAMVDTSDCFNIEEVKESNSVTFTVNVAPNNAGRVIGKKGRVANAMRTILQAVAGKEGQRVYLNIEPTDRLE